MMIVERSVAQQSSYSTLSHIANAQDHSIQSASNKGSQQIRTRSQLSNPNGLQHKFIIKDQSTLSPSNFNLLSAILTQNDKEKWSTYYDEAQSKRKEQLDQQTQSIAYQYAVETRSLRNKSVDVAKILDQRKERKKEKMMQNSMGFTIRENLRVDSGRFDAEMDKAFRTKDLMMATTDKGLTLNPKAIQLPQIKSGLNTPNAKDILANPLKNRSHSISQQYKEEDLDAGVIGQNQALKNKDYDQFKKLQRKQLDFSVNDIEIEEETNSKLEYQMDQDEESLLNEIQSELGNIEREIGSQTEQQSKLNKIEDTFQKLKDFCKEQLSYSYKDVNKQIDKLLIQDENEVSPLLKFYNELAASSNFRLPLKSLLQFDQKVFRKHLQKIKKSHQIEMKWIEQKAKQKAQEMLKKDYEKTKDLLSIEIQKLMEQHLEMSGALASSQKESRWFEQLIIKQENSITQLQEYIRFTEKEVSETDEELADLDQNQGLVEERLIELHQKLMICGMSKGQMAQEESFLKDPFPFYSSYIHLTKESKIDIMQREIVLYYKSEIGTMETQVELAKNENEGNKFMVESLLKNEETLKKKIEHLNNHVERLIEQNKKDIQRQANSYQEVINNLQREKNILEEEVDSSKKIFTLEVTVLEALKDKLMKEVLNRQSYIKELKMTLKIPRLHYKFIEDHGIHDFVKQCMSIIDIEQKRIQMEEMDQSRIIKRKQQSIQNFIKNIARLGHSQGRTTTKVSTRTLSVSPTIEELTNSTSQTKRGNRQTFKDQSISHLDYNQESRTTVPSPSNLSLPKAHHKSGLEMNNSSFMIFDSKQSLQPYNVNKSIEVETNMTIFYALIAKKRNIILSDYTEYSGNFQQYTMQLMNRIEEETKKSFELEEYMFHYINEDGLTVLCMTDKQLNKKIAFAFLQDLRKTLMTAYTGRELENAKAFSLTTFTEKIREKIQMYNNNPSVVTDKTDELFKELQGLKDGLVENLDKLIERDGKIEVILQKAESLSTYSKTYKQRAKKYRVQQRNRRICYIVILALVVIIMAFFIAVLACGGFKFPDC